MKTAPPVIVTGACGWIGREVCRWLKQHKFPVIACDLSEQEGPWDHFIRFDISYEFGIPDRFSLGPFQGSLDEAVLIHCAGYAHRPIETVQEVQKFYSINADGTDRVVTWCRTIGLRKIVYVSSVAFYDWGMLQGQLPLSETAAVRGASAYALSKLRGEEMIRKSAMQYRIVRLATVFGVGDKANFAKLADAQASKQFAIPGDGCARKSVISVNKAAEWLVRYALMERAPWNLINLGFQHAPTLSEICHAFSHTCDFPEPRKIPLLAMKGLGRLGDMVAVIHPSFPLTTKNLEKLTTSTWVDCSRAVELFPEAGELTFLDELSRCADYYRDIGARSNTKLAKST